MSHEAFIPLDFQEYSPEEMQQRADDFYGLMNRRRSVRTFSNRQVDRGIIDRIIHTASTAPSGAHKQPWTFCVVTNPELRAEIRKQAEHEERISYESRMSDKWLKDLEPLGTDAIKPYIEEAPYIIVVMKQLFDWKSDGSKHPNYYVNESVGIAVGMLLAAIHNAGLVALTHTPSPMNFLAKALKRPENERPYLLIPVGYPAPDVEVPALKRKSLNEVCVYYD